MIQQNYSFCRGCGAQIIWTRTPAGKNMPCDPEVILFTPGGGPETFVTPEGKVERGQRSKPGGFATRKHVNQQEAQVACPLERGMRAKSKPGGFATRQTPANEETKERAPANAEGVRSGLEGQIGYIPHWATCPKAKRFKKEQSPMGL